MLSGLLQAAATGAVAIFMTPRVIYDTNQLVEASDELKSDFKRLTKLVHE